jgi:tRNA U34 5-methylaminomethyl-2-thiouridine-forming methyltransferase MnmC
MPPVRPKIPTGFDHLDWIVTDDGSRTLWDRSLKESYHSGCGAVAESLVVYLSNSGVLKRLQQGLSTSVLEVGLGTCTTLLLTATLAARYQTPLDYWAVEDRLLPPELIRQLDLPRHIDGVLSENACRLPDDHCVSDSDFALLDTVLESLLRGWHADIRPDGEATSAQHQSEVERELLHIGSSISPGDHRHHSVIDLQLSDEVRLHLIAADITQLKWERLETGPSSHLLGQLDAVFYDAFSPEATPQLWSQPLLSEMYRLLRAGGTLTTYCVKSHVRKTLTGLGFDAQRLPGPVGGKREVLLAVKPD